MNKLIYSPEATSIYVTYQVKINFSVRIMLGRHKRVRLYRNHWCNVIRCRVSTLGRRHTARAHIPRSHGLSPWRKWRSSVQLLPRSNRCFWREWALVLYNESRSGTRNVFYTSVYKYVIPWVVCTFVIVHILTSRENNVRLIFNHNKHALL